MSYSPVSRVYSYISKSPKTEFQVRQYLKKKKVEDDVIEELIKKLYSLKLLDDEAYAGAFVRTQNLIKPLSKRLMLLKLRRKGVSDSIAKLAVNTESLDETDSIKELLRRQSWRWSSLPERERKMKASNYLIRLGFSSSLVYKIIKQESEEEA